MILGAIEKGLEMICFTDHFDKDNMDWGEEDIFDPEEYFSVLTPLQEKYRDRIHAPGPFMIIADLCPHAQRLLQVGYRHKAHLLCPHTGRHRFLAAPHYDLIELRADLQYEGGICPWRRNDYRSEVDII